MEINSSRNQDEKRLESLGYKQGLKRQFNAFEIFGLVLSNTSVLIGIIPLFGISMYLGGPVALLYGWIVTGLFTLCIGLSLAEICSSYPTAGGLYYWSAKLAGARYGPFASWCTCWFNLMGQISGCAGCVYAASIFTDLFFQILIPSFSTAPPLPHQQIIFYISLGMMVLVALVNAVGGKALKILSFLSVAIHTVGVLFIGATLLVSAPTKQPSSFVFGKFIDGTGWTDVLKAPSLLVFLIGLMPSASTLVGYDSSAHLSEETHNAHLNGPRAIILTIITSLLMGLFLILSLLFSIQDFNAEQSSALGSMPAQIFVDCAGTRIGALMILMVALAGFLCACGAVAANSRMIYAFSRDGGLPLSSWWSVVDRKSGLPQRAVFLSCVLSTLFIIPSLFSAIVFNVICGISIIGFTLSYAIPIFLRITIASSSFKQSEFNLGRFSHVIGWIACLWASLLFVVFQLPNAANAFPVTVENFNFAPLIVLFLITFSLGWWVLDARRWFKGPVKDLTTLY